MSDTLHGERSALALNYPSPVDPANIGRVVGPDLFGAMYRCVGVEGRRAYYLPGAPAPAPAPGAVTVA